MLIAEGYYNNKPNTIIWHVGKKVEDLDSIESISIDGDELEFMKRYIPNLPFKNERVEYFKGSICYFIYKTLIELDDPANKVTLITYYQEVPMHVSIRFPSIKSMKEFIDEQRKFFEEVSIEYNQKNICIVLKWRKK